MRNSSLVPDKLRFVFNSFVVLAGSLSSGFGSYLFQALVAAALTVSDFGTFSAVVALFSLVCVPITSLVMYCARETSKHGDPVLEMLPSSLITAGIQAILGSLLLCVIVFIAVDVGLLDYLDLSGGEHRLTYFFICVVSIVGLAALSVTNGVLQGKLDFVKLSLLSLALPLAKLGAALSLLIIGSKLLEHHLLIIFAAPIVIGLFCGVWVQRRYNINRWALGISHQTEVFWSFGKVLIANLSVTLLIQFDIVLAKQFLGNDDAGFYALAAMIGKAVCFVSLAVSAVLLPMVARSRDENANIRLLLHSSLLATLFALCAAIFLFFFGNILAAFFFGKFGFEYGTLFAGYTIAMMPTSVLIPLEHYFIANDRLVVAVILVIIAPLQLLWSTLVNPEIWNLIFVTGSCGVISVVCSLTCIYFLKFKPIRSEGEE